ncbi:MAG TPA: hypothetical protein VEY49_11215 [Solirubrobacteraceae bacterium]|nr:hypothetical protein [Solirubrobacteraceae bacterium]
MSRAQRLGFLAVAALIAVLAVVLLSGSGNEPQRAATGDQATATPSAAADAEPGVPVPVTPEPTATPKPAPPLVTPGKFAQLRFTEGETIRFRVRADTTDHVHVHGYDLMKDVEPGRTVTFSFPASITGIFEVELEDAGEEIARLRVDP